MAGRDPITQSVIDAAGQSRTIGGQRLGGERHALCAHAPKRGSRGDSNGGGGGGDVTRAYIYMCNDTAAARERHARAEPRKTAYVPRQVAGFSEISGAKKLFIA